MIAVPSLAGWTRSHYHADTLCYSTSSHRWAIGFQPGRLVLLFARVDGSVAGGGFVFSGTGLRFDGPPWKGFRTPLELGGAWAWERRLAGPSACVNPEGSPLVAPTHTIYNNDLPQRNEQTAIPAVVTAVAVPLWVPLAVACLGVVVPRGRRRAGTCRSCGYDLRATPDRCPECGTTVERRT